MKYFSAWSCGYNSAIPWPRSKYLSSIFITSVRSLCVTVQNIYLGISVVMLVGMITHFQKLLLSSLYFLTADVEVPERDVSLFCVNCVVLCEYHKLKILHRPVCIWNY